MQAPSVTLPDMLPLRILPKSLPPSSRETAELIKQKQPPLSTLYVDLSGSWNSQSDNCPLLYQVMKQPCLNDLQILCLSLEG